MADESKPPTGTEPEFLWALGVKFLKSKVPRIPLDLEPPKTAANPPDQFDDDFWRWSYYRSPKLAGWLEIEALSSSPYHQ
jgi:hypothetical protein